MHTVGDTITYYDHTYRITLALVTSWGIGIALAHGGGQEYITATMSASAMVPVSMVEAHDSFDHARRRFVELVTELMT